jgi:RNA polymerase sigma-70 factor (ECF subfamily)
MNNPDPQPFDALRPLMFSIAYRMLGSSTEADDILQEAYLRYQAVPPGQIESPKAFLTTVTTRLCLNQLASARSRRETYIGPWLPEPVLTEHDERFAPAPQAELHDSLSVAFLVLLEQLTPEERAVFLLREVFDYEYGEIAAILDKEEAACRQLLSRARKHVRDHRPRFTTSPAAHRQILNRFIEAVGGGSLDDLLQLLSQDVVLWADGGGKVRGAVTRPLSGREAVARFLLASTRFLPDPFEASVAEVNGEPALLLHSSGQAWLVVFVGVEQAQVNVVRVIGNPDKLKGISGARP